MPPHFIRKKVVFSPQTLIFLIPIAKPQSCETVNSVISNNLSFKYQRLTPSGCKNLGIVKIMFEAEIINILKVSCYIYAIKANVVNETPSYK